MPTKLQTDQLTTMGKKPYGMIACFALGPDTMMIDTTHSGAAAACSTYTLVA